MTDEDQSSREPDTRFVEHGLAELRAPERIGSYAILEVLGEGGMGTVYLAEEADPSRRVALKVIKPGMDSREVLRRFRYEQRTLARMNHDAIAKVFGAGVTDQQRPYFVMEWVDGSPLDEYCDLWQLDLTARLRLLQAVCAGVQHAHDRGAVHRDLKPGNVLVARQGDEHRPKVIDFGLARALEPDGDASATAQGQLLGTPEYMAPEQVDGEHRDGIGVHTDIYALGVMLYQLITGAVPFTKMRQLGLVELQRVVRDVEPPTVGARVMANLAERAKVLQMSPGALRNAARRELSWIAAKAIHKDPAQRYATASELAADLQRFLDGKAAAAGPDRVSYRVAKFVRRRRVESAAAFLVGASLVAGVVGIVVGADEAQASSARALLSTAQLAQERGNWSQALASLDAAAVTGRVDPVLLRVGRLLAHVGGFDDRAATAELRQLEQIEIPPPLRSRVLLLRGLFANRTLAPDAGLDLVRKAIELGGLSANEIDLAAYLVAETFDEARTAIERAVARDPHDRLANLAKMSMLFCGGYVDDALAFGKQLEAVYPDDPIVAVPLLLQAVLAGKPDDAEAAGRSLVGVGDDEGITAAIGRFAKSAGVVAKLDDQVVGFVFDDEPFGLRQHLEMTSTVLALPVVLTGLFGNMADEAPQRMLKTLGSMLPPCWSRGFREVPRLIPMALSLTKEKPSTREDALVRDVMQKAADQTGLALFRFLCGYLHAMKGEHAVAAAEYERAARAGQLIPVPRAINRGLMASNYRLWQDAPADQKPKYRTRALAALRELLPHARRARAFEHFVHIAADLDDSGAVATAVDTWRRLDGHDAAAESRTRKWLEFQIQSHTGERIERFLRAALGD